MLVKLFLMRRFYLMQNINVRKAIITDIDSLIKLRLDYLQEDYGDNFTPDEISKATIQLREYFNKYLDPAKDYFDEFIAVLAEIDDKVAATAFMVITEVPANIRAFPTGKKAVIINVLTYPEYRRQGIATKLLSYLIDEAKKSNISFIELSATRMGKSVYEKLGFTESSNSDYTKMRLKLF